MHFLLDLLLNAAILLLLSKIMPSVKIRSFGTALGVALVVGILNATIGAILRFGLNLVTFFILSFFVRLLVTAFMIKIADKLFSGFEVRSLTSAVIIACVMAVAGTIFSYYI